MTSLLSRRTDAVERERVREAYHQRLTQVRTWYIGESKLDRVEAAKELFMCTMLVECCYKAFAQTPGVVTRQQGTEVMRKMTYLSACSQYHHFTGEEYKTYKAPSGTKKTYKAYVGAH